jgi:hypothetical protein
MSTAGILMFVFSMISSWWVDSMNDSEELEVGTVILKSSTRFLFEILIQFIIEIFIELIICFIEFIIEALLEALFD